MALDLDTKLRQGRDHVATSIGSETAMMSIIRGRYYAVGGVAEHVWEMLAEPTTPREIVSRLIEEYDVSPARCEVEVMTFLQDLLQEGLATEEGP